MATLQATRATLLGLPEDSAFSWGLNRAIFYAAAKRGFQGGGGSSKRKTGTERTSPKEISKEEYYLGSEKAYLDKESSKSHEPIFTIGGSVQTPKDFEKQIISRFGNRANFEKAWKEALAIVGKYDRDVLGSQQKFYDRVYKPRRDILSKEWTDKFAGRKFLTTRS